MLLFLTESRDTEHIMILVTTSIFWLSWASLERVRSVLLCKATHLTSRVTANLTTCCITMELLSFILIISHQVIMGFYGKTGIWLSPGNRLPLQRRMEPRMNLVCTTEATWQQKGHCSRGRAQPPFTLSRRVAQRACQQPVPAAFTSNK